MSGWTTLPPNASLSGVAERRAGLHVHAATSREYPEIKFSIEARAGKELHGVGSAKHIR
jgi:hypothetical protein